MQIHILPEEVASQIAAGEVVERPSSVVKELLENALDARAGKIDLRIEQAGRRLISIADNGMGIPSEEMQLAVARHATSKLRNAEDLFHITTLGFRGEALASIGSVSRLTLTSRTAEREAGARLKVEGGRIISFEAVGVPVGTVVEVEDLFYNVPARLKFLKQDSTERQQIDALVTRYALAYANCRFSLQHDGRTALQTTGSGNRREVLAQWYGIEIARQMLEVSFDEPGMQISGFISPVAVTRSNRREITFFVNGRWVQDITLTTALIQAYHTLLMVGRYPLAALFVDLAAEDVDVNVHPAKAEVRFRQPDQVFSGVQRAVRRALLAYSPVPQVSPGGWRAPQPVGTIDPAWSMQNETQPHLPSTGASVTTPTISGTAQDELPTGKIPLLRLLGQLGATYLAAEGPDGLYLIDQHAAHERVLFEKMMKTHASRLPSQALLEPVILQLSAGASHLLEENLEVLAHLGFEVDEFGQNSFRVRAIPTMLTGCDPAAAVRVVVEDFEEDETPLQAEVEARIAARVCKRAAVKAGQVLSVEEQKALLRDLENCASPRTCPHGRPTMIHLSVDLLERQFGRRGSR